MRIAGYTIVPTIRADISDQSLLTALVIARYFTDLPQLLTPQIADDVWVGVVRSQL